MKNWEEDDGTEYCTAKEDLADAVSVCDKLGINLHIANFSAEYWDNVFRHFLKEYKAGRTPNPDILCNREIKFKAFLEYATGLGADLIATGHYVRKEYTNNQTRLLKGSDTQKDQSYFLSQVSEKCLHKSIFPIGDLKKSKVRNIAKRLNLSTHSKKDSTGIYSIQLFFFWNKPRTYNVWMIWEVHYRIANNNKFQVRGVSLFVSNEVFKCLK